MQPIRSFAFDLSLASLAAVACAVIVTAPAYARPSPAPAAQKIVVLHRSHEAFSTPDHRSSRAGTVNALRPITGERTVLPLLRRRIGTDGRTWLQVLLPGRPNGHTGWISSAYATLATTQWRIVVQLSTRRVTIFRDARRVRAFTAVIGKPSTPTPLGHFFVEETVQLDHSRVGAPFALALSARSNVLQEFDGGPGQIALHGTGNIGGVMGTAASHGCIRLDSASITWLAERIGPGVPVTIKA